MLILKELGLIKIYRTVLLKKLWRLSAKKRIFTRITNDDTISLFKDFLIFTVNVSLFFVFENNS